MITSRQIQYLLIFIGFIILRNNLKAQDTITVQTLTWDSTGRSYWYTFPEISGNEIERINMVYNMRCHNAAVGNGSVGCREWDYSCNTFITDTFRLDSIGAIQRKYVIPNMTSGMFYYSNSQTFQCLGFNQKKSSYTSIGNEVNAVVGKSESKFIINGNSGRQFLLYTAQELRDAGLKTGKIQGLRFNISNDGGELSFLRIRMKSTNADQISAEGFDFTNMTEVYFKNTLCPPNQSQTYVFYNAFNWDGVSNIVLELNHNGIKNSKVIELQASNESQKSFGTSSKVYSLYQNGGKGFLVDKQKLKQIEKEISISFWTFGEASSLPAVTSAFEGVDSLNRRQINVHLPWENGSIYWDCGQDGTGYDRIEKAATENDYEGKWVHWTFTKNAVSGNMNIYKNGSLWHSGNAKKRTINIDKMMILSNIDNQLSNYGRFTHFAIWNKELDSTTIKKWIFQPGNTSHPFYNSLLYYFPLDKNVQGQLEDLSPNPISISTKEELNWFEEKGRNLVNGFENSNVRPVTTFIQGTLNGYATIDVPEIEEVPTIKVPVKEYEILKGTAVIKNSYQVFPAGEFLIFDEKGEFIDVKTVPHDGIFVLEDLRYQQFTPSKFELLSLVTPYGNGLDLTKDGKTFVFDVTDYAPILRGNKKLSIELGGEYQEELNIKFQFIKGKPSREVKEIQNIYKFQRQGFASILNDVSLEPRNLILRPDAKSFKIRTTVTGHEQNGEFVNRSHFIKVEGNKQTKKFDFNVWKECADNPIYPQGGTWIFDRAGWCPGAASNVNSFDITTLSDPGSNVKIDYGLNGINLDQANYLISCQLVSYGDPIYKIDAGIDAVVRPNSTRIEFERFNPSCSRPAIQIKNYGSADITSINIAYSVVGGSELRYTWKGILKPLGIVQVDLPVDQISFWSTAIPLNNFFKAEIIEVNNIADENTRNNSHLSKFNLVKTFDFDPVFEIRTNNVAGDNSFRIKDMNGALLIEKNNISALTTIQENLMLPNGCYTLEVNDKANDGLSFWFYPNFGNGSISFKKKVNTSLAPVQSFKPDFGSGLQFDFIINKVNSVKNFESNVLLSISPNPASDFIDIEIQSPDYSDVHVEIINSSGLIFLKKKMHYNEKGIKETVSLEQLPVGIYLIKVIQNKTILTRKLVIE